MECIPAIDLKGGKCVRLTQGKFEQQNLYSDDPLTIAKRWVNEGATRLHIIDLDGARVGSPSIQHLGIIRDIIRRLQVPIQLGGGIRSREVIERMLGIGIARVILGSAAVFDPLIGEVFRDFGERVVLGVDARDGMVAVSGWADTTQIRAVEFAQEMESRGACRIIFTDISRDGMLQGVNLPAVQEIVSAVKIPVIAAGGVSSVEDIAALAAMGAEGAILGKALYENMLRLPDAIAAGSAQRASNPAAELGQGATRASGQNPAAQSPSFSEAAKAARPVAPPTAGDAPAKPFLPWATPPKK